MNDAKRQLLVIRRWAWLLAAAALLGAAAGFWVSNSKPIFYQAGAKVMVSHSSAPQGQDTLFYYELQMNRTYMELVNTPEVLAEVEKRLGFPVYAWQISIQPLEDTLIFWVNARDAGAQRAALIANATVDAFDDALRLQQDERYAPAEQILVEQIAQVETDLSATLRQVESLTGPDSTPEQADLQDQLRFQRGRRAELNARLADLHAEKARGLPSVTVLQEAYPPPLSIARRRPQATLSGMAVGLLLAAMLILTVEFFDDRLHTPEDIRERLRLPVLGVLKRRRGGADAAQVEALRKLRLHLGYAAGESRLHTLLVSSPGGGEAHTGLARALALAQAQAGRRTILVDLNLREAQPPVWAEAPFMDIEDLLGRSVPLEACLPEWGSPPILALAARPQAADPAEWLASEALAGLLRDLKAASDFIVVDAAGGRFADPLALAGRVDGVLLALKAGADRAPAAQDFLEQMQRAGGRVLGAALMV